MRYKFKVNDRDKLNHPKRKWHSHFVLFPTTVEGHLVWLETVDRRGIDYMWPMWLHSFRFPVK